MRWRCMIRLMFANNFQKALSRVLVRKLFSLLQIIFQGFNQITSGVKQRGKEQSNWSLALHPVVKIKKKKPSLSAWKREINYRSPSAREKETP